MLGIQSESSRDTRRQDQWGRGEHTKTDSQVVHVLDLSGTRFKITVINVFKKIDYQMENFNGYLKAIKINQMENFKLKNRKI